MRDMSWCLIAIAVSQVGSSFVVTDVQPHNTPSTRAEVFTISGLEFGGGGGEDVTPSAYVSDVSPTTVSWSSSTTVLVETALVGRRAQFWLGVLDATASSSFTFDGTYGLRWLCCRTYAMMGNEILQHRLRPGTRLLARMRPKAQELPSPSADSTSTRTASL